MPIVLLRGAASVLEIAKEIPPAGALVRYKDVTFTIKQATAQAIHEVRVTWKAARMVA